LAKARLERPPAGAYAHSPPRSLFLGSKTSDRLRSATVPTLLLR